MCQNEKSNVNTFWNSSIYQNFYCNSIKVSQKDHSFIYSIIQFCSRVAFQSASSKRTLTWLTLLTSGHAGPIDQWRITFTGMYTVSTDAWIDGQWFPPIFARYGITSVVSIDHGRNVRRGPSWRESFKVSESLSHSCLEKMKTQSRRQSSRIIRGRRIP